MKVVAVSGYFDPPHIGHLRMFEEAKKLGDILLVIVNNEEQQKLKGSIPFMPLIDRIELLQALKPVDIVVRSIDKDKTVCSTLKALRPDIFANGGDRGQGNVPEESVCEDLGIKMVYGVGGGKVRSSSELINEVRKKTVGMDDHSSLVAEILAEDHPRDWKNIATSAQVPDRITPHLWECETNLAFTEAPDDEGNLS